MFKKLRYKTKKYFVIQHVNKGKNRNNLTKNNYKRTIPLKEWAIPLREWAIPLRE
jgi:hypothetical protein